MESIKFEKHVSKAEFITKGMILGPKTVDRFLELQKLYDKNRLKLIKFNSSRFIFEDVEYIISKKNLSDGKMKSILISAVGQNNEIGIGSELVWRISNDLKRFKELTTNHFILMGRKTFESFGGRMLPNRIHVVISKSNKIESNFENLFVFASIEKAVNWMNANKHSFEMNQEKFYVIGGGEIYRQMITNADKLEITEIEASDSRADIFFPIIDLNNFNHISSDNYHDEKTGLDYKFTIFDKHKSLDLSPSFNKNMINKIIINNLIRK